MVTSSATTSKLGTEKAALWTALRSSSQSIDVNVFAWRCTQRETPHTGTARLKFSRRNFEERCQPWLPPQGWSRAPAPIAMLVNLSRVHVFSVLGTRAYIRSSSAGRVAFSTEYKLREVSAIRWSSLPSLPQKVLFPLPNSSLYSKRLRQCRQEKVALDTAAQLSVPSFLSLVRRPRGYARDLQQLPSLVPRQAGNSLLQEVCREDERAVTVPLQAHTGRCGSIVATG